MNTSSVAALAAALVVAGCATPTVVETVKPGDSGLTCPQLQNEFADAEQFRKHAESEKGMTGGNVARALFFWPAILGSYSNANEAISAADARKVHLANLMDSKHCAIPGTVALVPAPVPESARAAVAARGTNAPTSTAAPGLPLAGTTWTYGAVERIYSDRQVEVTVRVVRVDDTIVEELLTSNVDGAKDLRRDVDARKSMFLEYPIESNDDLVELSPYLLAINGGNVPSDIQRPTGYPRGNGSLPPWAITINNRSWERVTVHAGTFTALRIDVAGNRDHGMRGRGNEAEGRFEMTIWYAPEVKRFIKLVRKAWSADTFNPAQTEDSEVELLSYRPSS
ncbi:MAG: hypothetical protein WCA17_10630 [Burkholderiales bacterium]